MEMGDTQLCVGEGTTELMGGWMDGDNRYTNRKTGRQIYRDFLCIVRLFN